MVARPRDLPPTAHWLLEACHALAVALRCLLGAHTSGFCTYPGGRIDPVAIRLVAERAYSRQSALHVATYTLHRRAALA